MSKLKEILDKITVGTILYQGSVSTGFPYRLTINNYEVHSIDFDYTKQLAKIKLRGNDVITITLYESGFFTDHIYFTKEECKQSHTKMIAKTITDHLESVSKLRKEYYNELQSL
jgi:hypothetical protein